MILLETEVRQRLKELLPKDKIYLKKNYKTEVFYKHKVSDEEINTIFNLQKIISISSNLAFDDRVDIIVQSLKDRHLKVIVQFDPIVAGKKITRKVGIITAFFI